MNYFAFSISQTFCFALFLCGILQNTESIVFFFFVTLKMYCLLWLWTCIIFHRKCTVILTISLYVSSVLFLLATSEMFLLRLCCYNTLCCWFLLVSRAWDLWSCVECFGSILLFLWSSFFCFVFFISGHLFYLTLKCWRSEMLPFLSCGRFQVCSSTPITSFTLDM